MKEKTSIALPCDVLAKTDRLARAKNSRPALIERFPRRYLPEGARTAVNARDLEKINQAAEQLNAEAADVAEHQPVEVSTEEQE